MTEAEAAEAGYDVEVHKHSMAGNGRAMILGETDGLVKVVAAKDGPILGFHMVGPWASELMHEGYLAVNWEALPGEVGRLIHAHPSLSEAIGETMITFSGRSLHGWLNELNGAVKGAMSDEWVVTMPKLGETVTEGRVGSWLKQVGDTVAFDDPLFEVSTGQGRLGDPQPVRRRDPRDPGRRGRPCRSAPRWCGSAARAPGETGSPRRRTRVAAGGGPSLATPRRRRWAVRGPDRRGPGHVRAPTGEVHDITMPKLGETVTEGTVGTWLKAGRRHGRVRRPAVRGVHRQGRLGDPQPVRRGAARDPGASGRDGAGRHRAGPDRRARGHRRPAGGAATATRPAAPPARRHRRAPAAPAAAADRATGGCSRRWSAGSPPRTASTWQRSGHRCRRADPARGRREGDRAAAARRRSAPHRPGGSAGPATAAPRRRPAPADRRARRRRGATRATRSSSSRGCGSRSRRG